MKKYFLFIPFFIFIGLILYSLLFKWSRIAEIDISTRRFWLEEEQKNQLIGELRKKTKPYLGQGIWTLSIRDLRELVKEHPKVEEAQVLRFWPNRFRVVLFSEPPVLLWMGHKNFYPITEGGKKLAPLPISRIPDLPILRGKIFFDREEWRKKAVRLIQLLPKTGRFSQKNVSEITYSTKDSNFYIYLVSFSSPIRVGENLLEFRPDRIENVLRYLEQKKINWRVIDARFSQKVVVSLDNDS